jgi:hypothetical protein
MIPISSSLACYWSDPTNRAAVNLLADKTEVPLDLRVRSEIYERRANRRVSSMTEAA